MSWLAFEGVNNQAFVENESEKTFSRANKSFSFSCSRLTVLSQVLLCRHESEIPWLNLNELQNRCEDEEMEMRVQGRKWKWEAKFIDISINHVFFRALFYWLLIAFVCSDREENIIHFSELLHHTYHLKCNEMLFILRKGTFFIHFMCPIFSGSDCLLCGTQLVQQFFKSFFRQWVPAFSFNLFSHALIPSIRVSLVINYYIHQHHRLSNETSLLPSSIVNYSLRAEQSTLFIIVEVFF